MIEAREQIKEIKVKKKCGKKGKKRKWEGLVETDGRDKLNMTRAVKKKQKKKYVRRK